MSVVLYFPYLHFFAAMQPTRCVESLVFQCTQISACSKQSPQNLSRVWCPFLKPRSLLQDRRERVLVAGTGRARVACVDRQLASTSLCFWASLILYPFPYRPCRCAGRRCLRRSVSRPERTRARRRPCPRTQTRAPPAQPSIELLPAAPSPTQVSPARPRARTSALRRDSCRTASRTTSCSATCGNSSRIARPRTPLHVPTRRWPPRRPLRMRM